MKTLEDALSVAVEIPHGRYRLARDPYALISNEGGCARLDGYYEPSELRRIADHLDPQPDVARPTSRFNEALMWTSFCRTIGIAPASYEVVAHQVNARVVRVRREALEEAAKAAEDCDSPFSAATHQEDKAIDLMADRIAATIRDLIEKEPQA